VLEEEKSALQCSLQDELDKTSLLKAELLKFQAVNEKNRMLIETLRNSLVQEEEFVSQLTIQRMESKALKEQWDTEKEDFSCQIAVLTEERDAAQSSEEVLFERLGERTQDLGTLQESYVDMTDRCNDAHDEILELREQVQTFQAALQERNAVFSTTMSVSCLRMSQDDTVKMSTSWDEGNEKPVSKGKERKARDGFQKSPVKKAFDADVSACFTAATASSSNATPREVIDIAYESDDQPSTRGNSDKICSKIHQN
jgi:chromosome segregation ATPase